MATFPGGPVLAAVWFKLYNIFQFRFQLQNLQFQLQLYFQFASHNTKDEVSVCYNSCLM